MERAEVPASVAACLVREQFPQWAGLPLAPVEHAGWDNTTYRLGDELSVRLPTAGWYAEAVEKEHRWLPVLADFVPLPIPRPVAVGRPGCGYPWPWGVYRWLPGAHATVERVSDMTEFARSLGEFLKALYAAPADGGPPAGEHNFNRGASPAIYDAQTREVAAELAGVIDADAAIEVWEAGVAAEWTGTPVWLHGDLSPSNLLVEGGRLSAVIDFGTSAVGDPACDLAIAWTFFSDESRVVFRETVGLDDAAWARGRAWMLWKALITLAKARRNDPAHAAQAGPQFAWRVDAHTVIQSLLPTQ